MADATLLHDTPAVYEPSLFGTYSKKIGMWLFLLSDSLTFGALLYAYSYGRISTPNWPTPFHSESIVNATIMTAFLLTSSLTMVLAVRAAVQGDAKAQRLWLLAPLRCGAISFPYCCSFGWPRGWERHHPVPFTTDRTFYCWRRSFARSFCG